VDEPGDEGRCADAAEQDSVFVDFSPMADLQNENNKALLLDTADEPIVSDPVSPESGKIHA
jgi:hypothetical protein